MDRPALEPLAAFITLLRPRAVFSKIVSGAGDWGVRYARVEQVGYGLVLAGQCRLAMDGAAPLRLEAGDFVLMPPSRGFTMSSGPDVAPRRIASGEADRTIDIHHGDPSREPTFRLLGGYFSFEAANRTLLSSLMPALLHVPRANATAKRLIGTVELLTDEALEARPGRDLIVERLVEILLVEALRHRAGEVDAIAPPGLLGGLADGQLTKALRAVHADVARPWTVATLAREAGLSRSAFSERFAHKVGMPPMEYLVQWRMALAKDILQRGRVPLEKVAATIGYRSASAFSTAFRRCVGTAPREFARRSGSGRGRRAAQAGVG